MAVGHTPQDFERPGDGSVEMEDDDHDALMMISGGALHVVPNATRKSHGKTNCAALRLP